MGELPDRTPAWSTPAYPTAAAMGIASLARRGDAPPGVVVCGLDYFVLGSPEYMPVRIIII